MKKGLRVKVADFLNKKLYEDAIFYFDYWTFIHFISGVLLAWPANNVLYAPLIGFVLVMWEALEISMYGSGLFREESSKNIIWDIIFGMVGWLFAVGVGLWQIFI